MPFKQTIGIFLFCLLLQVVDVQGAACDSSSQITCIGIAGNGDVLISWINPNPANIVKQYIYSSQNKNGPYKLVDSIFGPAITTDSILGANANSGQVYFFMQNYCPSGILMPAKDTISTMFLGVSNTGNGTAILNWNALHRPVLSTSDGWYRIYREYPAGVWTLLDSTRNLSYIDTITICHARLDYRIETGDNSGCNSISSIAGGVFQNKIVPYIPALDSVSVVDTNKVSVGWNPSKSLDTRGYIVYRLIGAVWISIDTVYGINNVFYKDATASPTTKSENYEIAAFDSCNNASPLGPLQNTIFLQGSPNPCARFITLNWCAYNHMPSGLKEYDVYMSTTGASGPFTYLGANPSTGLSYVQSNLTNGQTYWFLVEAKSNLGSSSSTSNVLSYSASAPPEPVFSYLATSTVTAPNTVKVFSYVDTKAVISHYNVMRSESSSGPFDSLGSTPFITGNHIVEYTDTTALTSQISYYYKTIAVDTCGNDTTQTNVGRTILLTAVANNDLTNTLTWNDYEFWLGTVSSYNIYRAIDGVWSVLPLKNVLFNPANAGTNVYVDTVSSFYSSEGTFSYYVQALEGTGNMYGLADTSLSNIATALQNANVYIPNAFVPNGVNKVFIPVCAYTDKQEYDLSIFDRWGEKVYETTDPYKGWDGTIGGRPGEEAVYVYLFQFKTAYGQYVVRKGMVALLR
jgi:gliding motility-associated-like protein